MPSIQDLVPSDQERLLRALRQGVDLGTAARHAGLDPHQIDTPELRVEIARAQADAAVLAGALVKTAMKSDWRAAAWYLSRRNQDDELDRLRSMTTDGDPE